MIFIWVNYCATYHNYYDTAINSDWSNPSAKQSPAIVRYIATALISGSEVGGRYISPIALLYYKPPLKVIVILRPVNRARLTGPDFILISCAEKAAYNRIVFLLQGVRNRIQAVRRHTIAIAHVLFMTLHIF